MEEMVAILTGNERPSPQAFNAYLELVGAMAAMVNGTSMVASINEDDLMQEFLNAIFLMRKQNWGV